MGTTQTYTVKPLLKDTLNERTSSVVPTGPCMHLYECVRLCVCTVKSEKITDNLGPANLIFPLLTLTSTKFNHKTVMFVTFHCSPVIYTFVTS